MLGQNALPTKWLNIAAASQSAKAAAMFWTTDISIHEAAKQCDRHPRTLGRWARQRDIGLVHIGKTPYLHVPTFREALRPKPKRERSQVK